ncbi:MAG TPA: hypothetical protein VME42_04925 [Steroidobacteraceae bacterium]|nr:hypothetical protein [Steroidobacteraceae bacterium]
MYSVSLMLSGLAMIWLLWHYPKKTLIASFLVVGALSMSGALSQTVESDDPLDDQDH